MLTDREFKVGASARPGAGSKTKAKSAEITYVFKKTQTVAVEAVNEVVGIVVNETDEGGINKTDSSAVDDGMLN